jgi:16S rRNA (guanine966-N2)-methyltransferase
MPAGKKPRGRDGAPRDAGQFRIIGGEWRRRRLSFPARRGVRPTGDRVRETLFNWLQPVIVGARCLDLFAGSGALGLEALSRGAAHVTFVDRDRPLLAAIDGHLARLGAGDRARCVEADARTFLAGAAGPWDVVFLDPPFDAGLLAPVLEALPGSGIAPGARVYIEHAAASPLPPLPAGWERLRDARAGNVRYHLALAGAPPASDTQPPDGDPAA